MNDPSLFDELTSILASWQRRRLLSDAMVWLPRGLLAGLVAAAALAALARFRPILHNSEVALISLGLALLGLIVSLMTLLLRRHPLLEQARFFDRRFGLQERTSAAVEIRTGRLTTTSPMAIDQLTDAVQAVNQVDLRQKLPLRPIWRDVVMILLAGFLLLLAVTLPNAQSALLEERQAVTESIAEQIVALQALQRRIQDDPELSAADRRELLGPVESALEGLESEELSREEAVAALSESEAELRELFEASNSSAIGRALQAAGQSLMDNPLTQEFGDALTEGDLATGGSEISQLADQLGQLSTAEASELAQQLAQMASGLQEVDPDLAGELSEAAEALQGGDIESAQGALREAAATMQQRALEQAASVQSQAAADSLQSAREQVASAGSAGEPMAGDGQAGQEGSGLSQGGQDEGSNGGQGALQGGETFSQEGQEAGGPGPGGGHAESVFVPDYAELGAEAGAEIELPAECVANPEACGALISETPTDFTDEQSLVPYDQVFGDYRNAAFEALEGDYIPLGLKGFIRDYFSTLEP